VPDLESSLKKYLRCIMPIVSESDYKRTENLVEEFLKKNGTGYFLQNLLQNFSNEKDNWVRIFQFFSILF
jgi:hypothetical protein